MKNGSLGPNTVVNSNQKKIPHFLIFKDKRYEGTFCVFSFEGRHHCKQPSSHLSFVPHWTTHSKLRFVVSFWSCSSSFMVVMAR